MSSQPVLQKPSAGLSVDQQRAQYAWLQVRGGVDKEYLKLTKDVPTLIMSSGLLQTLAFLAGKKRKQHDTLLGQLAAALRLGSTPVEAAVKLRPEMYRAATEEALALLRWLRHFAAVVAKAAKEDAHG